MNVAQFQAKWRHSPLKERSAAQEHFIDLCHLLGMPTPADADREGSFYAFEKGAEKTAGGDGFADVWYQDRFAWEYKGYRANLNAAYAQLLQYREDLGNPPLLGVCDLHTFQVHTNFTGTAKRVHEFTVDDLDRPEILNLLRLVFADPYALRPDRTVEAVTEEAARRFGDLADAQRAKEYAAFLANVASAWQTAMPSERNSIARALFEEVWIDNRKADAVIPRPELLPFFVSMECKARRESTLQRKRRGSVRRHLSPL